MEKIKKSEDEWKKELTEEQYYVCRQKGTERAFTAERQASAAYLAVSLGTLVCSAANS